MFGRPPPFSQLVAQFDAKLNQLSTNDGQIIHALTVLAKQASPADIDIITACVSFKIIMNLSALKLPVVYLLDSITKNCGPAYVQSFSATISALLPAIYDLIETPEERAPYMKLVSHWVARNAFHPTILQTLLSAMQNTDIRRPQHPYPSGWPATLPPASASLPTLELTIADYFYKSIFPLATPTQEELNFTKDSLATLVRLLQPLNAILGRPQDPEQETLLQNYDVILQCRRKLQEEGPTDVPLEVTPPQPEAVISRPSPSVKVDPSIPSHTIQVPIQNHAPIAPRQVENDAPRRASAPRPTISDPRTLPQYCQANIDLLYQNMTHRCSTCGLRFKTGEELSAHLDWHYFERTSHLGRQSSRGSKLQRQWYLSAKEWIETNGGTTGQLKNEEPKVSSSASKEGAETGSSERNIVHIPNGEQAEQSICKACGDEIEQSEYNETDGWFYPRTIRGADGTLYHEKCAPAPATTLTESTDSHIPNTPNSKKRTHDDEAEFDELMVSPDAKKQKLE